MLNQLHWIHFLFLIFGMIWGSIPSLKLVTKKNSLLIFAFCYFLVLFGVLSKISFGNDVLDHVVVSVLFLTLGYISGIDKTICSNRIKKVTTAFRYGLILIFVSTTFYIGYSVLNPLSFKSSDLVHIEESENYRIKHYRENSNFTFTGYHKVKVFERLLFLEYPMREFNIGLYGDYGFNASIFIGVGNEIPMNRFFYDELNDKLVLEKFHQGKYRKTSVTFKPATK